MHSAHVSHYHYHHHHTDNYTPIFVFFTLLTIPTSQNTCNMEEEKYQNAVMEFKPLSFHGNTNNESDYMHVSLQETPQNYVEFLSQSGVAEIQNQMAYNAEGVAVNNLTCLLNNQEQESNGDCSHILKYQSTEATAVAGLPSRIRSDVSKQKAREADRRRRSMISGRLDALQELLPHFKEGGKASALHDAIDYIKYLQFQVKGTAYSTVGYEGQLSRTEIMASFSGVEELSRSRLLGESTSSPLIFLEGYGHYLLQEQVVNESLEEMVGKLLEENPSEAVQLLQSRGLYVMPMALAEGLSQGI